MEASFQSMTLTQRYILNVLFIYLQQSPPSHDVLYDIAAVLYALNTTNRNDHVLSRRFDLLSVLQPFNLGVRIDHFTPQDYFLSLVH